MVIHSLSWSVDVLTSCKEKYHKVIGWVEMPKKYLQAPVETLPNKCCNKPFWESYLSHFKIIHINVTKNQCYLYVKYPKGWRHTVTSNVRENFFYLHCKDKRVWGGGNKHFPSLIEKGKFGCKDRQGEGSIVNVRSSSSQTFLIMGIHAE